MVQPLQLESLLLYLQEHAEHISSISLCNASSRYAGPRQKLRQLPKNLQPAAVSLKDLQLQLQDGDGWEGVLHASTTTRQLEIDECDLIDGPAALQAALLQLPNLEHLVVNNTMQPFPGNIHSLLLRRLPCALALTESMALGRSRRARRAVRIHAAEVMMELTVRHCAEVIDCC